ncbi:hypothetical protein PSYJA_11630 [Pseudomonas syringae pv. japonica str. M301072]|uniref:Uncharacterized protein n=1 Tax=Pseudomonas syringae pv. japonica str. M301072 TaxID=629262 RepID=F3FHA0_PSESX|nr:hypothetical protein PSYJA_11630 [Pseudomonas syringae pv. japonica str. M301072]
MNDALNGWIAQPSLGADGWQRESALVPIFSPIEILRPLLGSHQTSGSQSHLPWVNVRESSYKS